MSIRINQKLVAGIAATLFGVLLPSIAAAQVSIQTPSSVSNFSSLPQIISRTFNVAIGVSSIIFVVLLLIGGVQYLTSLGVEDSATKARKLMLNAAIGLVIVISSWAIGNYALKLFGIQVNLTGGQGAINQPAAGGGGGGGSIQTAQGVGGSRTGSDASELRLAQIAEAGTFQEMLRTQGLMTSNPNGVTAANYNVAAQKYADAQKNTQQLGNSLAANGSTLSSTSTAPTEDAAISVSNDGTIVYTYSNGSTYSILKDGTEKTFDKSSNWTTVTYPDGTEKTFNEKKVMVDKWDPATNSRTYYDGSYDVYRSDGSLSFSYDPINKIKFLYEPPAEDGSQNYTRIDEANNGNPERETSGTTGINAVTPVSPNPDPAWIDDDGDLWLSLFEDDLGENGEGDFATWEIDVQESAGPGGPTGQSSDGSFGDPNVNANSPAAINGEEE